MKKVLLLTITIVMLFTSFPTISTYNVGALTYNSFGYEIVNSEIKILSYNGKDTTVVIPAEIDGYPVTSLGNSVFSNKTTTTITIPHTVRNIGRLSFDESYGLIDIFVDENNDNFSSVDGVLFDKNKTILLCYPQGKTATEYIVPSSVISIGVLAFYEQSKLTSVTIPYGVTTIDFRAFEDCENLTSITIPESVTSIDNTAFRYCDSLIGINVADNNPNYSDVDGVFFNKDKTVLIQYPVGKTQTSYTIPDSVTSIGNAAFEYCSSLTSITIPNSVTSIGSYVFCDCDSLTSITIPDSVTSIGDYAFEYCSSLTSVTIGNSVTSIGYEAFSDCSSLTSVIIPDSVTSIGGYAFEYCSSLTSVTIGNSVTSIGGYAFEYCSSLTSITVADNNPNFSSAQGVLFNKYKTVLIKYPVGKTQTSYTIPDSVTSIGGYAFEHCSSLTSITIPNSVTSIGSDVFHDCDSLTSITIPDSVTRIGGYVFYDCDSLTSITIPDSVTSIGNEAFYNCDSLTNVWYCGRESDRTNISVSDNNECLTNAKWHYNTCSKEHSYKADCDATCNDCEWTRIVQSAHDFEWVIDKENNCGVNGSKHEECTVCQTKRNENTIIEATGDHDFEWIIDRENNCGVNGSKHEECTVCQTKRNENTIIEATGDHDFEWIIDKENNCGVNGLKHEECSICKTKRNENTVIEATGDHTFEWVIDKENNCGVNGYKHEECSICKTKRNENTVIYATGNHSYTDVCDDVCNVCQQSRTAPHDFEWIIDKENNCGVDGYKHEECTVCQTVQNKNTVINATGDHNFEWIIDKGNNCGVDGYKHEECKTCFATRSENTVIEATGDHKYTSQYHTKCNICGFIRKMNNKIVTINKVIYSIKPTENGGLVTVTGYEDDISGEIVIPETIEECTVIAIGDNAFENCNSITSISIPETVTSIGEYAFANCVGIKEVYIPQSVTEIGDCLFMGCTGLLELELPFLDRKFAYLFGEVQYGEISNEIVPLSLKKVTVNSGTIPINSFAGCNSISIIVLGDGVTAIGGSAFQNCNSITTVTIGNGTQIIGSSAFYNCVSLTRVIIGDGTETIDNSAFKDCVSLFSVSIGANVTKINDYAFQNCFSLSGLKLPSKVENIGNYAFSNCKSIAEVVIPDSTDLIGSYAFENCTSMKNIIFGKNVTTIFNGAFKGCSALERVILPNSTTSVGEETFANCTSLERAIFKGRTDHIDNRMFENCTSLIAVAFPKNVNTIAYNAFYNCVSLKEVWFEGTETELAEMAIAYGNDDIKNANWFYGIFDTLGHKYENDCDTTCNICGDVRPVPDHIYTNDCDTDCNVCGKTRTALHILDNPTCTLPATCGICGATSGEKLGHSFTDYISNNDATCTNDGTKTAKCNRCDETNTVIDIGSKLSHTYNQEVATDDYKVSGATCAAKAVYNKSCVCGLAGTETFEYGEALGHSFTDYVSNNDATCTNDGTKIAKCDRCEETNTMIDVSSKLGHDWKDATCIEPKTCKVCGATEGVPLGHDFANATCTEAKKCTVCGTTEGDKLAHTYTEAITKAPTCAVAGEKTLTCACGDKKTEVIAATGTHTLVTTINKATYKAKGSKVTKCSVCGVVIGTEKIPKLVPKSTKISKVTAAKNSLKIKIKKEKSVSGYEIQYSLKKNFKSAKKVTLKKNSLTTKTIKKLKAKKIYYVRVRTFKTVNGKKYYSAWSKSVKKKTK